MGCSSILEFVQPGFKGMSTIISVCFCSLQKKGLREREIMIVIHFPEGKKSSHQVNLSAKEMKVVADVGCGHQPTAPPAPAAVQGRGVSCIYIYISIYLYIYAFPSQSLISDSTSQLGCWYCRRIQNEGPFLMVLWLGLDQTRQHLFTEVRIPVASCPSPPGMGLFLYRQQLWLPACLDAVVWLP